MCLLFVDYIPPKRTFVKSEDSDEMRHNAQKEIQYVLESITCDPSIYTMDHLDLTVSSFMGRSIGLQRGSIIAVLTDLSV